MADIDRLKPHQWKKGQSGCPGGKPKGAVELSMILRKRLGEQAIDKNGHKVLIDGSPANWGQLFIETLIKRALEGNAWACQMVFDRMDGAMRQKIGIEVDTSGPTASTSLMDALDANPEAKERYRDAVLSLSMSVSGLGSKFVTNEAPPPAGTNGHTNGHAEN